MLEVKWTHGIDDVHIELSCIIKLYLLWGKYKCATGLSSFIIYDRVNSFVEEVLEIRKTVKENSGRGRRKIIMPQGLLSK